MFSVVVVIVATVVHVFGQSHRMIDVISVRLLIARKRRRTAVRTTPDAGFRTVRRIRVGYAVHAVHSEIPNLLTIILLLRENIVFEMFILILE